MLSATSLGYAVVRDQVAGRDADKRRIDAWLRRIARHHF
jgi:hypothetical protein